MTDEELVRRLQAGDPVAFETLYERYQNLIVRTAALITGSRQEGEDLAQECFLRCWQQIGTLRDPTRLKSWLLTILTRSAWRADQKRKRETPVEELWEEETGESSLDAVLRREDERQLYRAIRALPDKQRTIIVLYYFNDLSVREIARITGRLEGTVKSRLFSARRALRSALGDEYETGQEVPDL